MFSYVVFTSMMAGVWAWGQQPPEPGQLKEEDAGVTVDKEYAFNPLQAEKEMQTGDFYAKKGAHKAAAGRYEEALKWNPGLTAAWRKLAVSRGKLKDEKAAAEAWKKVLELEPEAKDAKEIRKRIKG
jgi:tetratricopeptide (TPR) repeat protein